MQTQVSERIKADGIYNRYIKRVLDLVLAVVFAADWADSRFQLWKGAENLMTSVGWATGYGMGQFGNRVAPLIPELYFFTPFAASWHPHPHNELLHLLTAYGAAGGGFLLALIYAALASLSSVLLGWIPNQVISAIPIFQVGIPAFLSIYFDLFSGCIQALVFCMLTMVYVGAACPPPEETAAQS